MASRGSPVVLESVNSFPDVQTFPPLKKRKTWHPPAKDLGASSIVIRAPATSLSDDRYVLDPITLLPRSRVPFSWLDPSSSTLWPVPSGSLFVADIPILENDLRERIEPTVLAVRSTADGGLYVVERVKNGIYAVSRLGPWVQEGDIFVAVKGWSAAAVAVADEQTTRCQSPVADRTVEWWEVARVEEPIVDVDALSGKRARLDICVAFFDQEEDNVLPVESVESQTASIAAPNLERSSSTGARMPSIAINDTQEQLNAMASAGADDLQTAQELLDGLGDQYLQALYISKTSLAYFAKGPQTRCRNAFQSTEPDTSKTPIDLVNFYREAILPAKKMDLKYKETIPATVRDVMLSISDDETAQTKKRKSRKKKKLGKNGLYPDEEDFIRKWWKDRSSSEKGVAIETSREAEMKKHVADLRLRETQLQILLILETMALESALPDDKKQDGGTGEDPPDEKAKKSKSKKLQDLNVVLELHLDRLCIWHAVSFEDIAIPESIKYTEDNHLSGKKAESDAVRDFCMEVIIPFYASRLPDKCKLITRKFGISSSTTPAKSQARKTPRRESESAAKRQLQQQQQQHLKPRRSLQRVLTDEKSAASQGRHPLQRSKTAPSKPDSRRESMEPLLPVTSANVRGGIQKAKRVENREVDLNAQARQHETKLKKVQLLADQKKELDAAIHALRRPNRELVAKDIAEDADKRTTTSGGGGSSRKQKNPVRNPLGQGVQVMATPKGSRKRDTTFDLPPPPLPINMVRSFPGHSTERSPPPDESDAQMVPGSTVRPTSFSGASGRDMGAIQETPTRRPTKSLESPCLSKSKNATYTSNTLFRVPNRPSTAHPTEMTPSTPVSSRRIPIAQPRFNSSITETPPRKQQATGPIPAPVTAEPEPAAAPPTAVLSTPVKKGSVQETLVKKNFLAPGDSSTVPVTPEKSIYEQLGWNEDEDLGF